MDSEEIRRRLKRFGMSPGPITETTRATYLKKLRQLESTSSSSTTHRPSTPPIDVSSAPPSSSFTPPPSSAASVPPPPSTDSPPRLGPAGPAGPAASWTCDSTPPSTIPFSAAPSISTCSTTQHASAAALCVVDDLLGSLRNPHHPSCDTLFMFNNGEVSLCSSHILMARCQALVPLVYSYENPFLAHVKTLMGNTYPVWMRPSELVMDLKEKVYLQQGIPVFNQKLFYNNCEIGDGFSMQACNISLGSTVHIVLTGPSTLEAQHHSSNAFSAPLMTISHLQLSLGLERLESAFGGVPSAVPPAPIPPQVTHVVHVHDVPCDGLRLFLQYLYTGRLNGYNDLCALVTCHVLGERFALAHMGPHILALIQHQLTPDTAASLATYAREIGSADLLNICSN